MTSGRECDQIYFSLYTKNESTAAKLINLEGTFNVLGTMKKGVRESYNIKLFKHDKNQKGSFWCSCPDHKFNSAKRDMVCKHICFILCKVGRIFRAEFFDNKQLLRRELTSILKKIDSSTFLEDKSICKVDPDAIKQETFYTVVKQVCEDDDCCICFDSLNANFKTIFTCIAAVKYSYSICSNWQIRVERSHIWRIHL